ncbi:MAG: ABC transporter ATP-binding protein, partial [Acidimicrobiales bacterium]|nr:ABC transporter ATP-binding protein [Acidimicrobiales bacterium]
PPPPVGTVVAQGVTKAFGSLVAVSEVSFAIGPGVTALLGPNGAGKSTLLRVLCGLSVPTTGTVSVGGGDPRTTSSARAQIGLVPQQDGIFERDTIGDFVMLAATLSNVEHADAAVDRALALVELQGEHRPLGNFSKGMRQRAKIAAALVHNPSILFLDEPLNGLDPKQRRSMISLFHNLGAAGKTVVVSSHVLDEVERFGSNVLVMARGRLAAQGDFHAIRRLMNDQPLRFKVVCQQPRQVAAALIGGGLAAGVQLNGDSIELTTNDAPLFRSNIAQVCQHFDARLYEITPLDEDLESVFRYLVA